MPSNQPKAKKAGVSTAPDSGSRIKISAAGVKAAKIADVGKNTARSPNPRKMERISMPLTFYWLEEEAREFANNKYFPDALLSIFAFISVSIAFPFYPVVILIPLAIIIFFLSRLHPLAGLMALLFLTLPMYIYQAPLLALLYCLVFAVALIFGYKHYRTIIIAYTLVTLPFSYIGYFLEIPTFAVGLLYIGLKRAAMATAIAVVALPILALLTGLTIFAPIAYNTAGFSAAVGINQASLSSYFANSKPVPSLSELPGAFEGSFATFIGDAGKITSALYMGAYAFVYNIELIGVQLVLWLVMAFAITNHVIKSRSAFKGSQSSLFALGILAGYFLLTFVLHLAFDIYMLLGFAVAPLLLVFLELNEIDVVRALDVMKRDFLGTFGEAFEDLTTGAKETLNDIGNYEHTKEELQEAILQPIEHKGIAGAYKIKPAKGILLFGPPGTGKTMLMRALANEVRARFFYVKSSSILSPRMGESSQALSKIFDRVRTHTPAILFFDEIDGIARRRDALGGNTDTELLSTLLSEMDGFQKIEGVVIVGATNVPQLIDKSIMRPGRFDRIVYMPLPDRNGRKAIFEHYSKLYPMATLDLDKLAESSSRFSGADIANVCRETATHVGNEALKNSKALKIETEDLLEVIRGTKPSTSFAQMEEYDQFRTDYERRLNSEPEEVQKDRLTLKDVIGMNSAKKALNEALGIPLQHPELMKDYDLKSVSGILLYGPPGCGKTMLMNAIANDMESVKLISISGADLGKEGYENAVKIMKENFFRAKENAPSVLFIDEIDSLVPDRENASELGIRRTAEFLREFDEAKKTDYVVIVGATNRPDAIDPALLRPGRMDKLIYASPPDAGSREELFRMYLKKTQVEKDLDYAALARASNGFTGADIANVCREAKMQALEETLNVGNSKNADSERKINTSRVRDIIKSTTPSAPDRVMGRYLAFEDSHARQ